MTRTPPTATNTGSAASTRARRGNSVRIEQGAIRGSLGSSLAGARVMLLAASGVSRSATASPTGAFNLVTAGFPVAGGTLHLVGADGGYLGPLVLAVQRIRGDRYGHVELSGRSGELGRIKLRDGYALAGGASPRTYTTSLIRVTGSGRPAGAGSAGVAPLSEAIPAGVRKRAAGAAPKPELAAVNPAAAGADPDGDGIPNFVDQDDDGDLSPDSAEAQPATGQPSPGAEPSTGTEPNPGAPAPAETAGIPVAPSARIRLVQPPDRAMNAHTSDLTDAQLATYLDGSGAFTVSIQADPSAVGITDPVPSPWLSCSSGTWCGPGNASVILDPMGSEPLLWADYPGRVWASGPTGGTASDAPVAAAGNGIDTFEVGPSATDPTGGTRWLATLAPRAATGVAAEPDPTAPTSPAGARVSASGLPAATEVLELHFRSGADSQEGSLALTTGTYPLTVPVINEVLVGAIAGDTITTSAGQLALTIWRPQRAGLPGETGGLSDMAGLSYGLVLSDGTSTFGCAPTRYSALVGLAADQPGGDPVPLRDLAPSDLAVSQSQPLSFNLDVSGCLADAQPTTGVLASGSRLTATLMAATTSAQGAHLAEVPYQVVVP